MAEAEPSEARRVKAFASFFKNYMSVAAVVTAALPLPVVALRAIPMYKAHRALLATYTSLFCFLLLAYIFYNRHRLARWMFRELVAGAERDQERKFHDALGRVIAVMPLVLIVVSLLCVFEYHHTLDQSILKVLDKKVLTLPPTTLPQTTEDYALEHTPLIFVDRSERLMMLYLSIFLAAEGAFVLMATKEYLQDLFKIGDRDLILTRAPAPRAQ